MLLVLTSIMDAAVPVAIDAWRAKGLEADVLTVHDLAQPGWKLELDGPPTLVVRGKPTPAKAITAVITRIVGVGVGDLPFVHDEDREYAAAEMQAFLLALLTSLPCPVLNRPQPGSLSGPPWATEQWIACAARAGLPVRPAIRRAYAGGEHVEDTAPPDPKVVTVIGDQVFGGDAQLNKAALAVARAAGTELLRVAFDMRAKPAVFVGADTWIDLSDPQVSEAIRKKVAS
ncbi:MAG TPA: hypothetical protein VGM88_15150 [Kofleriaceae bacterium]|jgi:hypothetical protein